MEAHAFVSAARSVEPDVDPFDELTGDIHEAEVDRTDRGEVDAQFAGGDEELTLYRAGRDSEYLVIGDIDPTEYECRAVCRGSPFSPR